MRCEVRLLKKKRSLGLKAILQKRRPSVLDLAYPVRTKLVERPEISSRGRQKECHKVI